MADYVFQAVLKLVALSCQKKKWSSVLSLPFSNNLEMGSIVFINNILKLRVEERSVKTPNSTPKHLFMRYDAPRAEY